VHCCQLGLVVRVPSVVVLDLMLFTVFTCLPLPVTYIISITLWYVVLRNALLLKIGRFLYGSSDKHVLCVSKETSVRLVVGPFRINIRISLLSVILNVTFYLLAFKSNCDTNILYILDVILTVHRR